MIGLATNHHEEFGSGPQVSHDDQLLALWVQDRSAKTQSAYRGYAQRLLSHAGIPLQEMSIQHLQAFVESHAHLAVVSQNCMISAVRSLFTFATRLGYIPTNVGAKLGLVARKNRVAKRILTEEQVQKIMALEKDKRTQCLIRLFYASGARLSQLVNLRWSDCQPQGDSGQVTIHGKRGKTRVVLLSKDTWAELIALRQSLDPNAPIFTTKIGPRSGKNRPLSASHAWRIVKAAAERTGFKDVSPHWFRRGLTSRSPKRGAITSFIRNEKRI